MSIRKGAGLPPSAVCFQAVAVSHSLSLAAAARHYLALLLRQSGGEVPGPGPSGFSLCPSCFFVVPSHRPNDAVRKSFRPCSSARGCFHPVHSSSSTTHPALRVTGIQPSCLRGEVQLRAGRVASSLCEQRTHMEYILENRYHRWNRVMGKLQSVDYMLSVNLCIPAQQI